MSGRSAWRSWPCPASRPTDRAGLQPRPGARPGRRVPALPRWEVLTTYNTAGAARMIAERERARGRRDRLAAGRPTYGLEILADNVQSGDENRTSSRSCRSRREARADEGRPGRTRRARRRWFLPSATCRARSIAVSARSPRAGSTSRARVSAARTARWEYVFWVDVDADPVERRRLCLVAPDDLRAEPRWSGPGHLPARRRRCAPRSRWRRPGTWWRRPRSLPCRTGTSCSSGGAP